MYNQRYLVYLGHRLFYFDFMSQSGIPNQPTFTSFASEDWQTFYYNLAKETRYPWKTIQTLFFMSL